MARRGAVAELRLADALVQCHRDLFPLEARLAEAIAPAGGRIVRSIVDQWLVLEEYLRLAGTVGAASSA